MMKIVLLIAVLFVGAHTQGLPFGFRYRPRPRHPGVARQAAATPPPAGGSSSDSSGSSSSSSEEAAAAPPSPPAPTTPMATAPPIRGATSDAGDTSNDNDVTDPPPVPAPVEKVVVVQPPQPVIYFENPLELEAHKLETERRGRQSGALVALSVLGLVAGVATVSLAVIKYNDMKDAIAARLGRS